MASGGECRHPGFGIMGVAGGDMVGDDLGQIVGDIGCHGDLLRIGMPRFSARSCQFPSGEMKAPRELKLLSMEDIARMIEAHFPPKKRGPYKKAAV
jgi:hypothetical protein